MALVKRGNYWVWRKMVEGNAFYKSTKTGDKRLAEQIVSQWEGEAVREIVLEKRTPGSLHAAINEFTASRKHLKSYMNCVHALQPFLDTIPDMELKLVTDKHVADVQQHLTALGRKASTRRLVGAYWNSFVKWVKLHKNTPIPRMQLVVANGRIRWLTKQEETLLLGVLDPTLPIRGSNAQKQLDRECNYAFTLFLLDTGARLNEAANLDLRQLHLDADDEDDEEPWVLLHRSKGGLDTRLLLTNRLIAALKRWMELRVDKNSHFLFPSKAQVEGETARTEHWFTRAVKKAGLSTHDGKVSLHTLRHTFITRMAQAGMPLQDIQIMAGHKHVSTTLRYAHMQPGDAAARMKKLFDSF